MNTKYSDVLIQLNNINPIQYTKDRNYIDGSVSRLSSYISRGVISTRIVYDFLLKKGYKFHKIEKFIQELAWRDYWQLIWQEKDVNLDIKHVQKDVNSVGLPRAIFSHYTKIQAIDLAIINLYKSGYMHNHNRMYVASVITNIAKYHWKEAAKWMYYHLLDADWGSNALSWQWVCGTNSSKKYYANQSNINKYNKSFQFNTILDIEYSELMNLDQPKIFKENKTLNYITNFPKSDNFINKGSLPICIYNFYNIDPNWRKDLDANRILLLEPSKFKKLPISDNSMHFVTELAKNIPAIKIVVSEFEDLHLNQSTVYYKEHPLNYNYKGIEDSRDWLTSLKGYYPSFYKFWSKAKKELLSEDSHQYKLF